jgi:dUTPase
MIIKIKRLDKSVELPKFQRKGDAALDIRSSEYLVLKSGERKTISLFYKKRYTSGKSLISWKNCF